MHAPTAGPQRYARGLGVLKVRACGANVLGIAARFLKIFIGAMAAGTFV
jgi:hypothetical protein